MHRFYNVLAQLGASRPAPSAVVMRSMQIARLHPLMYKDGSTGDWDLLGALQGHQSLLPCPYGQ
jgi:hypothetical protein